MLLLAPMRAAAVLHRPVEPGVAGRRTASRAGLLAPDLLRSLADPTLEELLPAQPEPAPVPELRRAALILAKLGRLLPAVLAARCVPTSHADNGEVRPVQRAGSRSDGLSGAAAAGLRQIASARVPLENADRTRG